jgi:hypothetical protein
MGNEELIMEFINLEKGLSQSKTLTITYSKLYQELWDRKLARVAYKIFRSLYPDHRIPIMSAFFPFSLRQINNDERGGRIE